MFSRNFQGACWKLSASLCFAIINGLIKALSLRIPLMEIALFEHLFALMWLLPFLLKDVRHYFKKCHYQVHLLRACVSMMGIWAWYQALTVMPIAGAVALGFVGPLITSLGAIIFFKETFSLYRLAAVFLGFLGGSLISKSLSYIACVPLSWIIFFPMLSASAFAVATLMNKFLAQKDHPLIVTTCLMLLMTPCFGVLTFLNWQPLAFSDLLLLGLLGGITALAHFSMTQSFTCSDLLFLLPIGALRFFFTATIGWFFFDQMLGNRILLGFLVIMTGLFVLAFAERRMKRSQTKKLCTKS